MRAAWAGSGAMALTGRPGGPPLEAPESLPRHLLAVGAGLTRLSARLGTAVRLDPLALLAERAAFAGFGRGGDRSCGGATRLLHTADAWIAVSLARADDLASVPAWLELAGPIDEDPWSSVRRTACRRPADALVARGRLLGLPVSRLGEASRPRTAELGGTRLPVIPVELAAGPAIGSLADVVVVDLSSLWAGPLCGSLLGMAGARVIKVESVRRPDGARFGPSAFFDLLNAGKESVAIDLGTREGAAALRELVLAADVVIEASRPRALEQLGVAPGDTLGSGRPKVWVSITGHGRSMPRGEWVAFGDDAAVAGGLVVWDADGPCFCADAVADPATGLIAAAACLTLLAEPGRWLLDVALSAVARHLAGHATPSAGPRTAGQPTAMDGRITVASPWHRPIMGRAAALGADNDDVFGELRAGGLARTG